MNPTDPNAPQNTTPPTAGPPAGQAPIGSPTDPGSPEGGNKKSTKMLIIVVVLAVVVGTLAYFLA